MIYSKNIDRNLSKLINSSKWIRKLLSSIKLHWKKDKNRIFRSLENHVIPLRGISEILHFWKVWLEAGSNCNIENGLKSTSHQ